MRRCAARVGLGAGNIDRHVELVEKCSSESGGDVVEVLKVSSRSNPNSVAGALAGVLRQSGVVEVQVVGAGALNQAVKAIAIARGYLAPAGVDLICVPGFTEVMVDAAERTAIKLLVEPR